MKLDKECENKINQLKIYWTSKNKFGIYKNMVKINKKPVSWYFVSMISYFHQYITIKKVCRFKMYIFSFSKQKKNNKFTF